jgi:hypothetical protein
VTPLILTPAVVSIEICSRRLEAVRAGWIPAILPFIPDIMFAAVIAGFYSLLDSVTPVGHRRMPPDFYPAVSVLMLER